MKSFFLLLLICFGVCFLFPNDKEIRVRVISNSDSEVDILYKKEVVEFLKSEVFINQKLNDNYFSKNYKLIEDVLNSEFDDIVVEYGTHTFVNKTYNGSAVENKKYKTLVVYIGDANGLNWWGSIFDDTLQYESDVEVQYEWYFKKNGE